MTVVLIRDRNFHNFFPFTKKKKKASKHKEKLNSETGAIYELSESKLLAELIGTYRFYISPSTLCTEKSPGKRLSTQITEEADLVEDG